MRSTAHGRVVLLGEQAPHNDGLALVMPIGVGVDVTPAREPIRLSNEWAELVARCRLTLSAFGAAASDSALEIKSTIASGAGLASRGAAAVAVIRALSDLPPKHAAMMAAMAQVREAKGALTWDDALVAAIGVPGRPLFVDYRSSEQRELGWPDSWEIVVLDAGTGSSLPWRERMEDCRDAAHQLGLASLRDAHPAGLDGLDTVLARRARYVLSENDRVSEATVHVAFPNPEAFGALLDASHASLRDDYELSTPDLDGLVDALRVQEGVYGARATLSGAVAIVERGLEEQAAARTLERCPGVRSVLLR